MKRGREKRGKGRRGKGRGEKEGGGGVREEEGEGECFKGQMELDCYLLVLSLPCSFQEWLEVPASVVKLLSSPLTVSSIAWCGEDFNKSVLRE